MKKQGKEVVVISNDFLSNMPFKTTKAIQLFSLAVAKINPRLPFSVYHDEKFVKINISTEEILRKICRPSNFRVYKKIMDDTATEMARMVIKVNDRNSKGTYIAPIFSLIRFDAKSGLDVLFNPVMNDAVLDLSRKLFTQLLLADICRLKAPASIRLLEILSMYVDDDRNQKTVCRQYTVEEFKNVMGLPSASYTATKDLKKRVIVPSVKEINSLGNYHVEYQDIGGGRGRIITGFTFTLDLPDVIFCNHSSSKPDVKESEQQQLFGEFSKQLPDIPVPEKLADADRQYLQKLESQRGFNADVAEKYLRKDREKFLWTVKRIFEQEGKENSKGMISDFFRYFSAIWKNNSYEDAMAAVAEQEAQNRKRDEQYQQELLDHQKKQQAEEQQERLAMQERLNNMSIAEIDNRIKSLYATMDCYLQEYPQADSSCAAIRSITGRIKELQEIRKRKK